MTVEEKALALVNEITEARLSGFRYIKCLREEDSRWEALCRAIKSHEADKAMYEQRLADQAKAFSGAVQEALDVPVVAQNIAHILSPFIIPEPEPDPLVDTEDPIDALVDLLAPVLTHSQGMAARERENRFRNAIAALKAKEADNG